MQIECRFVQKLLSENADRLTQRSDFSPWTTNVVGIHAVSSIIGHWYL